MTVPWCRRQASSASSAAQAIRLSVQNFFKNFGWPILCGLLVALAFLSWNQTRQLKAILENPNLISGYVSNLEVSAEESNRKQTTSFAEAVNQATPSVVKIFTSRLVPAARHPLLNDPLFNQFLRNRQLQPEGKVERGLGSGVIVDSNGLVLTNYHVIESADRIQIMLADGRERSAKLLGFDEATDLALLSIDAESLPAANFANINSVAIGDVVLAIGNPYGIGQTVTQGIVSALGRYGLNLNTYENYIQTDAAINEGNSGGALINTDGEVIGINSGLYSRSGGSTGIGFAIPVDVVEFVMKNLIEFGYVRRGWLGISVDEITPALAEQFGLTLTSGLILTAVAPDGPAQRAGLQVGDIITHIEDQTIGNGNTGMHIVAESPPGEAVSVRLLRGNVAMSFAITLDERPGPINQSRA